MNKLNKLFNHIASDEKRFVLAYAFGLIIVALGYIAALIYAIVKFS